MRDPFLLDKPAAIAFSGGRTSGYMLWRIIRAHGGSLPPDIVPIFANTGKEKPQTLDFVERCSQHWGIGIVWVEFRTRAKRGINVINYATASRHGEPFEALIHTKQRLPNAVQRMCTQWLKILTADRYCRHVFGWDSYENAIGLRADEPDRVAKLQPDHELTPGVEPVTPLADAGVTEAEVLEFWRTHPFDLDLPPGESNCDLCFLKGRKQLHQSLVGAPDTGDWWASQEAWVTAKTGRRSTFIKNGATYAEMQAQAAENPAVQLPDDRRFVCHCTD